MPASTHLHVRTPPVVAGALVDHPIALTVDRKLESCQFVVQQWQRWRHVRENPLPWTGIITACSRGISVGSVPEVPQRRFAAAIEYQ